MGELATHLSNQLALSILNLRQEAQGERRRDARREGAERSIEAVELSLAPFVRNQERFDDPPQQLIEHRRSRKSRSALSLFVELGQDIH